MPVCWYYCNVNFKELMNCCFEFKYSGNIQKKEDRSDRSVSNNQFSSVTLNELEMKSQHT